MVFVIQGTLCHMEVQQFLENLSNPQFQNLKIPIKNLVGLEVLTNSYSIVRKAITKKKVKF